MTQPGQEFEEALDDDLNISAALGFLFESIRKTNRAMDRGELDSASANSWLNWWERVNSVLSLPAGVQLRASLDMKGELQAVQIPAEIAELVRQREEARLAKDFRKSDELRNELNARGWEVRDTKDGYTITQRASS